MTTSCVLVALLLGTAGEWQDGSLLALQDSNKPVANFTKSDITHVALLRKIDGENWVYEATPGRVRRMPLTAYSAEIARLNKGRSRPTRMWIMEPQQPYRSDQLLDMHRYLDAQLGRRYSIKGYVRGQSGDGIHCAEYCSTALSRTGRYQFDRAEAMSPSAVVNSIRSSHRSPRQVRSRSVSRQEPWGMRTWNRIATLHLWLNWACYEAWTLCW